MTIDKQRHMYEYCPNCGWDSATYYAACTHSKDEHIKDKWYVSIECHICRTGTQRLFIGEYARFKFPDTDWFNRKTVNDALRKVALEWDRRENLVPVEISYAKRVIPEEELTYPFGYDDSERNGNAQQTIENFG